MECANCKTSLPADAVFCGNCGTRVQPAAAAPELPGMRTVSDLATMVPTGLLDNPAAATLDPGSVFAERYVITRRIGAGGMGVVYVANDRNTGEDVALKLLHPHPISGPEAMKRLVAEGATARQIRHPNIVAVYDIAQAGGQPFLAMEYVQGRTLRSVIAGALRASREVPVRTAVGIVDEILAGLAEAHRMGVVHRDLKPENIIMLGDPLEGDCRLKILDFGIAKAVQSDTPRTGSGGSGILGTLLYMPPEQRTAPDTVGPPADLYSVAAMLFELLMETPPQGVWEAPSKSRTDVPAALDAVIERGLRVRARDRFASAAEFRAALAAAMAVPAAPAAAGPKAGDAAVHSGSFVGDLKDYHGALVAHDPFLKAWRRWRTGPAESPSAPPVPTGRKRRKWVMVALGVLALGVIGKLMDAENADQPGFPAPFLQPAIQPAAPPAPVLPPAEPPASHPATKLPEAAVPPRRPASQEDAPLPSNIDRSALLAAGPLEHEDFGVPPTSLLRLDNPEGPTPTTIPGGRVVDTLHLVSVLNSPSSVKPLILDSWGGNERLPGALPLSWAAFGMSFDDPVQFQLSQTMAMATGNNHRMPLVTYCAGPTCWMSYNVALRLIRLGYTNVYWYRGGMAAWHIGRMMTQGW